MIEEFLQHLENGIPHLLVPDGSGEKSAGTTSGFLEGEVIGSELSKFSSYCRVSRCRSPGVSPTWCLLNFLTCRSMPQ